MAYVGTDDFIFQQDNARCHTSRESMAWFEDNEIDVMTWPAESSDINPIENLWDELGRRLDGYTPRNKKQLWKIMKDEWYKITTDVTKKLVESMPRRLHTIIAATLLLLPPVVIQVNELLTSSILSHLYLLAVL